MPTAIPITIATPIFFLPSFTAAPLHSCKHRLRYGETHRYRENDR
jgi:hypothetical protein